MKKSKRRQKSRRRGKAGAEAKPAVQTNVNPPAEKYNSSWEEKQLVDYEEPEEPAAFSPVEEDNYSDGDDYPAHRDGPEDNNENTDEFPAFSAEAVDSVGGKRSRFFSGGGAPPQGEQEYRRR